MVIIKYTNGEDKMKRFIYTCAMLTTLAICMTGCGEDSAKDKENTTKEAVTEETSVEETNKEDVDVKVVADAILDGGDFKDNLAEVDTTMALTRLYSLDPEQVEASMFYTNSQATAEEIAVIKVKSQDYVQTVKDAYETRIADQKTACESYLPDEMPKLEAAVIYENGNYVVLCVSNDSDKALELIEAQFE